MGRRLVLTGIGLWLVSMVLASILFGGSAERAFAQSTDAFEIGPCAVTLAVQLPIEFEYKGTIPTGFDGINSANCTFTKEVETVTVTLTGPATHTETFTLGEPTTEVPFPLPEDTLSITTLEIVPPGEYQRKMTVTSVDGETLVISDQPGVLKTVTILSGQTPPSVPSVATITGTITYRERIALSPNAVVKVELLDVSRADAPAIVIGEQTINNPGQVPIAFEIAYLPANIDERFTYAVGARITERGDLAFINDTRYSVITRENPTHVDMVLVKVQAATPPSVGGTVPSGWLLLGVASMGALLIGFGVLKLYIYRPTRRA